MGWAAGQAKYGNGQRITTATSAQDSESPAEESECSTGTERDALPRLGNSCKTYAPSRPAVAASKALAAAPEGVDRIASQRDRSAKFDIINNNKR